MGFLFIASPCMVANYCFGSLDWLSFSPIIDFSFPLVLNLLKTPQLFLGRLTLPDSSNLSYQFETKTIPT
jgi:hypothetical protein